MSHFKIQTIWNLWSMDHFGRRTSAASALDTNKGAIQLDMSPPSIIVVVVFHLKKIIIIIFDFL